MDQLPLIAAPRMSLWRYAAGAFPLFVIATRYLFGMPGSVFGYIAATVPALLPLALALLVAVRVRSPAIPTIAGFAFLVLLAAGHH